MGTTENKITKIFNLIKHLHKPDTIKNACQVEDVDERMFRHYFNDDDRDIKICNVTFPVNYRNDSKKHRIIVSDAEMEELEDVRNNKKRTSMHPILLPLNMTEVSMLTNQILDILGENHPLYESYRHLASKIYSQLSPYAIDRLGRNKHNLKKLEEITFESEFELEAAIKGFKFNHLEKMNHFVRLTFSDNTLLEGYLVFRKNSLCICNTENNQYYPIEFIEDIKNLEIIN